LWECQGKKTERDQIAINNDNWQTGLAGLAKLIEYPKKKRIQNNDKTLETKKWEHK
jgi:hypothetical protein